MNGEQTVLNKTPHYTTDKLYVKVIQILAGGEVVPSTGMYDLISLSDGKTTATPIQWKDLPYTTAKPSEIILVRMDGTSSTYVYQKTVKHGTNSFTHTYLNRENPADLVRLVHII